MAIFNSYVSLPEGRWREDIRSAKQTKFDYSDNPRRSELSKYNQQYR